MFVSSAKRSLRHGFTLVEMLVVIAIIGILAGLITVAASVAIKIVKQQTVATELSQLDLALKSYKEKYGEYPPDGTNTQSTIIAGIPDAFYQHFQKVFPKANLQNELNLLNTRYQIQCGSSNYASFFQNYKPTTALAFWLGGMQEDNYSTTSNTKNPKSRFIGFSANPINPLSDNSNSRLPVWYEFNTDRINDPAGATLSNTIFRTYLGNSNVPLPFVYFRAELKQKNKAVAGLRGKEEYLNSNLNAVKAVQINNPNDTVFDNAVKPYYDVEGQNWVNPTGYQILFCGFDNTFGRGNLFNTGRWNASKWGTRPKPNNVFFEYYNDNAVMDDITNFAGGTIRDKMP